MTSRTKLASYGTRLLLLAATLGLMMLTSCGTATPGLVQPVLNLPVPSTVANTVPVTVGANLAGFPNAVFTSVTVCPPAVYPVGQNPISGPPPTAACTTIDNILVDTGSVGLRLLESSSVDALNLPVVTDSNNNTLQECVQFADFSYVWGPVMRATVQMAGETAAQVPLVGETANTGIPIQYIYPTWSGTPVPSDCLSSPQGGATPIAANTQQTMGANGILGVGSFLQDCGTTCASSTPQRQYYYCPSHICAAASVPQGLQLWNPVAAFAYDNNGVLLNLPFPAGGASGPSTGSLTFGFGTQSDNALRQANIYAVDTYGNFPQVTLTETLPNAAVPNLLVNYLSPQNGSYIDSASPAIYFSDAQTLAIPECLDGNGNPMGLYCPSSDVANLYQFNAQLYGINKAQYPYFWWNDNGSNLLSSGNSVISTLGGDSGFDASSDYVDFGLPFFLGKRVFVGFAGAAGPGIQGLMVNYPNGFWAW